MGKMGRVLVSIAVVGILGFSSFVYAQPAGDFTEDEVAMIKQRRDHRVTMPKMKEALGLTDEQVQQLDAQRNQQRGEIREHREAMQKLREEFKLETEKTEIDQEKIQSVHQQMKAIDNKMADYRVEGILQLRKILTPEQFKKFHELGREKNGKRGERREKRGMREGRGMGEGPGRSQREGID